MEKGSAAAPSAVGQIHMLVAEQEVWLTFAETMFNVEFPPYDRVLAPAITEDDYDSIKSHIARRCAEAVREHEAGYPTACEKKGKKACAVLCCPCVMCAVMCGNPLCTGCCETSDRRRRQQLPVATERLMKDLRQLAESDVLNKRKTWHLEFAAAPVQQDMAGGGGRRPSCGWSIVCRVGPQPAEKVKATILMEMQIGKIGGA